MASYDIAIQRNGGFSSLKEAKAHRAVIGKLTNQVELAKSVAADCREIDKADIGKTGSDLYKDLAPELGKVVLLSQPENSPLLGAELSYNPADGATKFLVVDMDSSKLTQSGSSYKLEENGVTTYFRQDTQRGVFTIMDSESEVPRIFGDADPQKLIGGTIQTNQPFILF